MFLIYTTLIGSTVTFIYNGISDESKDNLLNFISKLFWTQYNFSTKKKEGFFLNLAFNFLYLSKVTKILYKRLLRNKIKINKMIAIFDPAR